MAAKMFAGHGNCIKLQSGSTDFTAPQLSFLQLLHFGMLLFLMQHIKQPSVNRGKSARGKERILISSLVTYLKSKCNEGQYCSLKSQPMPIEICGNPQRGDVQIHQLLFMCVY